MQQASERAGGHAGGRFLGDPVARREHARGRVGLALEGHEDVGTDEIQPLADPVDRREVRRQVAQGFGALQSDQQEPVSGTPVEAVILASPVCKQVPRPGHASPTRAGSL